VNELALFAGAGGGILGGHLLGWRTVCAVEWESYPASVLCARQNDGLLPPFPIWDDVQTFDGKPWRGIVDVVSGGFPCQDISSAGGGQALMENAAVCGEKWHASLGKYNLDTSSWKTHQCSLLGDLEEFSETWPRWGLMRNGEFWEVKNLAHHIQGTEFGLSHPTPLKTDHFKFLRFRKESVLKSTFGMHRNSIAYWMTANHGKIPSAEWIYWVMGWPNGWANLNALETGKYQSWRQRHGESLVVTNKKEFND
jgi:DNA (cytosine-5)-methyltransferase 1